MTNGISENEKEHVPGDPDPEPSLSDWSPKKNKRDKKKKRHKHRKDDLSDDSDYRHK